MLLILPLLVSLSIHKTHILSILTPSSLHMCIGYVTIVKAPTNSTAKPTKTASSSHKPTKTITPKPTNKHEPSSVCVVVPNKNGQGSTVKCHPKPHKSQPKKKQSSQHKKKKQSSQSSKKKSATATRHPTVATPSI
jgi:septal ring-binding cell division protein DamX